ncbi:MAG TPA: retroviral-like aspartic protease family protein [Pyrinomonadaceae bacterium]|jgi:predicted aspartyl protease|nr:retroviral-like aspartic protease family protein [Pyrinomonadaceae bacterium]
MLTEVNFRLAGGAQPLMLVPVHVNGTGAYEFILDTGAGVCLLSSELAGQLGVQATEMKEGHVAGGRARVAIGSVESLAIGAAKVEDVQVAILDLNDLGTTIGAKIDGNIGFTYLKDFRITIDYKRLSLRLASGRHEVVGQRALTETGFRLAAPSKPLVLLQTVVDGQGPYEFALDTGASTTIISPGLAARLDMRGVPIPPITTGGGHKAEASVGNLKSISVGGSKLENFQVLIADIFETLNRATGASLDGIIGYNFLKEFIVTIDYPNGVLHLER